MRKLLVSLAAAASALAVATPASAQYYPAPQYYPVPQGPAYGYHNAYGQVRALQVRINQIQRQIERFDRRNIISNREARRLRDEARAVEFRLRETARYGLNPRERHAVEVRIARLEHRLYRDAQDGRRFGAYGAYNYDRDRDGRIDRYEDDRGRDHDDRWDD